MRAGIVGLIAIGLAFRAPAQISRHDDLAKSPMAEGRPAAEASKLPKNELLYRRATQTYPWALPLLDTLGVKVGSERALGARLQRAAGMEEVPRRQGLARRRSG